MLRRDPDDHEARGLRLYQPLGQRVFVFFLLETSVGRLTFLLALFTASAALLRRAMAGDAAITVWIVTIVFCAISAWAAVLIWSARGAPPAQPDGLIETPLGYGILTAIVLTASFFAVVAASTLGDPILWGFAAGLSAITLLSIRTAWRVMGDSDEESH